MDKKQRIMTAAESLFHTGQFQEITLDAVALAADVGKGTIYQYFASKDELFFQTAVAAFDHMCELLRQDSAPEGSVEHRLRRAAEAICTFRNAHEPLFRLIQAEGERALGKGGGLRQRWLLHRRKLTQTIAAIIRLGVSRRQVRVDISPEVLAEYFLGMLRTRFHELDGLSERDRSRSALVSLFLQGLTLRTPARGRGCAGKIKTRNARQPSRKGGV
jgi:AcrR family transcriptional regulator